MYTTAIVQFAVNVPQSFNANASCSALYRSYMDTFQCLNFDHTVFCSREIDHLNETSIFGIISGGVATL